MASLLQIIDAHKAYGTKALFEAATFSVDSGEHIGVIGPNGAGKSTLFKILAGEEELDRGSFVKTRGLRIGYLSQHDNWPAGTTLEQYLEGGTSLPIWELKSLGQGLGLNEAHFQSPLDLLSGGYRTRAKLLYLIGCEPDLLLLDEPTNYLDLESTLVLESFLQDTRSAFLLISHDREFLRRTTDHILEVEGGDIIKYSGGLDDYFDQKQLLRTQLESRALSQAQKRAQVMEFVSRFGAKASKAKQAQSRLKQLGKMEVIDLKALPVSARINIPPPQHCGKTVLTISEANLGYAGKTVLKDVNLSVNRGDHLAVVGVNGAGKSTLLKTLSKSLTPLAGTLELGHQVSIGYYAQHVAEALGKNDTVLEAMAAKMASDVTGQQILNLAGSLLFSGDDTKKKLGVLSGGEKARVALGQILLQKAPLLILDEPTNHLDFQTVEALTVALDSFEGSVIVVSHDRSFIRRVGRKILEIDGGKVTLYPGSYDEYVWSQQQGVLGKRLPEKAVAPVKVTHGERISHGGKESSAGKELSGAKAAMNTARGGPVNRRVNEKELARVEKQLAALELQLNSEQTELARLLSLGAASQRENQTVIQELLKTIALAESQKTELEARWLELSE